MVEQIMLFGIGFLVASLFNLLFVPLVHNRAVRLTMKRLEAATPFSMAEIQAEKDQLRAEFAMSTRRLEMSVEQLKAKTASQLGELGKKSMAIGKLQQELEEKSATIRQVEAREAALRDQLETTEHEYTLKSDRAQTVEQRLAAKETELATLVAALDERTAVSDSQRIEIATLRTQVESLKSQLAQAQKDVREVAARMEQERQAAAAAGEELAAERSRSAAIAGRRAELERQLAAQAAEAEGLGARVRELEERLTEQGRLLVEREHEARRARELADRAQAARAERAAETREIDALREENTRLRAEIAAGRVGAESSWESERLESALLRERINDIAAEVVRLTRALEGPESPIEAMLSGDVPAPAGSAGTNAAGTGAAGTNAANGAPQGDLVARIRALQARVAAGPTPAAAQ